MSCFTNGQKIAYKLSFSLVRADIGLTSWVARYGRLTSFSLLILTISKMGSTSDLYKLLHGILFLHDV